MRIDLIPESVGPADAGSAKRIRISTGRGRRSSRDRNGSSGHDAYQELLQSVYDGVVISDLRGRIKDANQRAGELLGYLPAELRGRTIFDFLSGSDEELLSNLRDNLAHHRYSLIQAYCQRQDGSIFPTEVAVNLLKLPETSFCFSVRDTTLRRQAEEMLRTEHTAIRNSGSGIAVANAMGAIEYANPAMAALWGIENEELLVEGDVCSLFEDPEQVADVLDRISSEQSTWTGVLTAVRADGQRFDVQLSAALNRNQDGEEVGLVLSFVDVSDRRRAEEASREAERHRVMLESLGSVSHLMGQPATALLANLQLLADRTQEQDQETRDLIQACQEAADHVAAILHRLHGVNEYKTRPYLNDSDSSEPNSSGGSRILDI